MEQRYLLTSDLMFSLIINARLKQKEIGIRQASPSWESLLIYLLSLILPPSVSNIIFMLFIHAWNEIVHNIKSGSLTVRVNVSCNLMITLVMSLRHTVSLRAHSIPEALAKFWRLVGSVNLELGYMVRKLRSVAFQRCIWRGGLHLAEMGENDDFLQKTAWKTAF